MAAPKHVAPGSYPPPDRSGGGAEAFLTTPAGVFVVAGIAVVVVAALVLAGGGLASPTAAPPTLDPAAVTAAADAAATRSASDVEDRTVDREMLLDCNGRPCPSIGPTDALVTVLEVTDYACSHCKDLQTETMSVIESEYVATGKVRLISRPYGFTAATQLIAASALCADDQGKYFEFERAAFASDIAAMENEALQGILDAGKEVVTDPAEYTAFEQCVRGGQYIRVLDAMMKVAYEAGVKYTPTMFINGLLIEGAEDTSVYRSRIDRALQEGN